MTTYAKENPIYLRKSLESVMINQSLAPNEFILVEDGLLPSALEEIVCEYEKRFPDIFVVVRNKNNKGQGKASRDGLKLITNPYFARMDSDDICRSDRFEKQYRYLLTHQNVDVLGGQIEEFTETPGDLKQFRLVPQRHDDIIKLFRMRMPLNNVTTMIRTAKINEVGGYGRDTVNEDYSVFSRMWVNGARFHNLKDVLVDVRVGSGQTQRRGDFRIVIDWWKDQWYLLKNKKHNVFSFIISCIACLIFVVMPRNIKQIVYKLFLRKRE